MSLFGDMFVLFCLCYLFVDSCVYCNWFDICMPYMDGLFYSHSKRTKENCQNVKFYMYILSKLTILNYCLNKTCINYRQRIAERKKSKQALGNMSRTQSLNQNVKHYGHNYNRQYTHVSNVSSQFYGVDDNSIQPGSVDLSNLHINDERRYTASSNVHQNGNIIIRAYSDFSYNNNNLSDNNIEYNYNKREATPPLKFGDQVPVIPFGAEVNAMQAKNIGEAHHQRMSNSSVAIEPGREGLSPKSITAGGNISDVNDMNLDIHLDIIEKQNNMEKDVDNK